MFAQPVQAFLKNKVQNDNLSTIELSKKVGISVSLTSELLNAHKPYPSLSTIIKIANAFNSPIEEVLGKTIKIQKSGLFAMITEDTAMNNLKKYIYTHINVSKEFARRFPGIYFEKSWFSKNEILHLPSGIYGLEARIKRLGRDCFKNN